MIDTSFVLRKRISSQKSICAINGPPDDCNKTVAGKTILEAVARDGIARTCAAYHISPFTYYRWRHKLGFTKPPRRGRFSQEEKLAILKEASQNGVSRVCVAYGIHPQTYYYWKLHKLGFAKLSGRGRSGRFSEEEKLAILEKGYESGILRTCAAYGISYPTYYNWRRRLGYSQGYA